MKRALIGILLTLGGLGAYNTALAQSGIELENNTLRIEPSEQRNRAQVWSFNIDNDLLFPSSNDRDYTGGMNLRIEGNDLNNLRLSLAKPLAAISNRLVPTGGSLATPEVTSAEIGIYGFTPDDTTRPDPITDDRPYASLLYYSNSSLLIDWAGNSAWESTLTLGVLGLGAFEYLQNEIHSSTGGDRTRGWKHQISEGGEPTLRYDLSRHHLVTNRYPGFEVTSSQQISVGYLTEASTSLGIRLGNFSSSWWNFRPDTASYGEKAGRSGITTGHAGERFFFAGVAVKARGYNAFLQGQFRDSVLTYDSGELNHLLVEAWAGYTQTFGNGYSVSYQVRAHTSELRRGNGDRNVVWGGMRLTKAL